MAVLFAEFTLFWRKLQIFPSLSPETPAEWKYESSTNLPTNMDFARARDAYTSKNEI